MGISAELEATVDEAMRLEKTDPAAANQLLDSYFMREAAATDARREDLRRRANHDRAATIALRRELKSDLATNAMIRRDVLKNAPIEQRTPFLAHLDAEDRNLQSEILKLDHTSAATMAHNDAPSLAAVMKAQGSLMPDRTLARQITVPALVIVGERDELRDFNRTLAAWWPRARFVEVPNATHMAILRRRETLAALRAQLRE
jgi:pimeloyl-ACP methyl ester carboxylesterase